MIVQITINKQLMDVLQRKSVSTPFQTYTSIAKIIVLSYITDNKIPFYELSNFKITSKSKITMKLSFKKALAEQLKTNLENSLVCISMKTYLELLIYDRLKIKAY